MILYWLVCTGLATLFVYFTWPRLESLFAKPPELADRSSENNNQKSPPKEKEPGITMGGIYIYATPERIIIWTTIKLIDRSGNEHYLRSLSKDNFTIQESYDGHTNRAPVLEVKSSSIPVRAILVIDQSGSMAEPSTIGKLSKMDVVKAAADFFVDQLTKSNTNSIAILPFSGDSVRGSDFLKSPNEDIWWSEKEKNHLRASINLLHAHGRTPLWQAVHLALNQLSNNEESYKVIICLSDGLNNGKSLDFNSLIETTKERQIPIFTIGYGRQGKLNDAELVRLSAVSGAGRELVGSFIKVPPDEWGSRLSSIGIDLVNLYELYWTPTGADPKTRVDVDITVSYEIDGERFQTREQRFYSLPERQP